jgi:hypothetical protein
MKCTNGSVKRLRCGVVETCQSARWRSGRRVVARTQPMYKAYLESGSVQLEAYLMVRL